MEKEKKKEEAFAKFGGLSYEEWCAQFRLRLILKVPEKFGEDKFEGSMDLPSKRNRIRARHIEQLRKYRKQRAPESHIHHEWIPGTAQYRGVAFVEAKAHFKGIIKVIEILDGNITLSTEKRDRDVLTQQKKYQEEKRRQFFAKVYI